MIANRPYPPWSLATRTGHIAPPARSLGMRAILLHGPLVVLAGFYTRERVTTTQCDLREQGGSRQWPGGRGPDSPAQRGRPGQPGPEPSANGDAAAADPATADEAAARTAACTCRAPAQRRVAAAAARVPPVVARSSTSRTRPPARRGGGAGGRRGGGVARGAP